MRFEFGDHRVLAIGISPTHESVSSVCLTPTIALDNFDYVVADYEALWADFSTQYNQTSRRVPPDAAWKKFLSPLLDWVERGQSLVLILSGKVGTESGAEPWGFAPFEGIKIRYNVGHDVRCVAPITEATLNLRDCEFRSIFSDKRITPLFVADRKSKGDDLVVGGLLNRGNGRLLFLPAIKFDFSGELIAFSMGCVEAVDAIKDRRRTQLPEWTDTYRTIAEENAFDSIDAKVAEIERLEGQINALEAQIDEISKLKALLSGTDADAESAARQILTELGAKVSSEIPRRAEALLLWRDKFAALEVKGLTGSSAENWLRQANTWRDEAMRAVDLRRGKVDRDDDVAAYLVAIDEIEMKVTAEWPDECYGILVSVTHRLKPLHDRTSSDHDHPPDMVKKLNKSHVVAVTGVQLLCLYLECKGDQSKSHKLLDMLFSGEGGVLPWPENRSLLVRKNP